MGRKAISNTFSVTTVEDGKRGKVGRFFYYAGDFDENNRTKGFFVNDAQSPFFSHVDRGGITRFHVFNPETNPPLYTMTMAAMWDASNGSWNNAPWEAMTNDFKYLITEAIFSNFAHLGGAIISGNWMISQHGTVNGEASTDYTKFNPQHPTDNYYDSTTMLYNFIPNFAIDLKKGQSILNSMVIRFRNIDNDYIWRSSEDVQTYGGVAGWVYQLADYSNIMTNAYAMQTTAHPNGAMRIVLPMDVSFIGRTITVFENSIPPLPSSIRVVEILLEEKITNNTGVFYGIGEYNLASPSSSFVSSELNLACGTVELVGVPAVVNNHEICRWLVKSTCCALLFDNDGHVYYGL